MALRRYHLFRSILLIFSSPPLPYFPNLPASCLFLSRLSLVITLNGCITNLNHPNTLASHLFDIFISNGLILPQPQPPIPYLRSCHYSFQATHSLTTISCLPSSPLFTVPEHLCVMISVFTRLRYLGQALSSPFCMYHGCPFPFSPSNVPTCKNSQY